MFIDTIKRTPLIEVVLEFAKAAQEDDVLVMNIGDYRQLWEDMGGASCALTYVCNIASICVNGDLPVIHVDDHEGPPKLVKIHTLSRYTTGKLTARLMSCGHPRTSAKFYADGTKACRDCTDVV